MQPQAERLTPTSQVFFLRRTKCGWTLSNVLYDGVCVSMTASCGEHHQHVVAADGERFGGAETFTDGPRPADHKHSRTR